MKPPWLPSFVLGMLFYFFFLFISNPNSDSKSILIVLQKSFLFLSCEFENRIFFFLFCASVFGVFLLFCFSQSRKKNRVSLQVVLILLSLFICYYVCGFLVFGMFLEYRLKLMVILVSCIGQDLWAFTMSFSNQSQILSFFFPFNNTLFDLTVPLES